MTLEQLLTSLTEAERNYIATRDYGMDAAKHREQLNVVIQRGGAVDMAAQSWFPYEVIELCKNHLEAGHEREFAACNGIVFNNMLSGADRTNDIDWMLDCLTPQLSALPAELQALLNRFVDEFVKRAGDDETT